MEDYFNQSQGKDKKVKGKSSKKVHHKKSLKGSKSKKPSTPVKVFTKTKENILRKYKVYPKISHKYYNDDPFLHPNFKAPNMGLKNDPHFCDKFDANIIENPDIILKEMNFITDYNKEGLARALVIKKMGHDTLPDEVSKDMKKEEWNKRTYDIPINATIIFTKKVKFHYYHLWGKNLFCNFQMYNHVPGHGSLTRKDLNVESVKFSPI